VQLAALEKFESDTMLKTGSIQFGPPPVPLNPPPAETADGVLGLGK